MTESKNINYQYHKIITGLREINPNMNLEDIKADIEELLYNLFIEEIKNYLQDSGFEVLAAGPFLQINKPITEKDWDINFIVRKK